MTGTGAGASPENRPAPGDVPQEGSPLRDALLTAVFFVLEEVLRFLPWRAVVALGGAMGTVMHRVQGHRRRRARQNLELALGAERDGRELRRIERAVFRGLGRNLAEICWVAARPRRADRLVTFEGLEHMQEATVRGRGVVLLTGHLGSWELMAAAIVRQGIPLSVIAREAREERANRLLLGVRERLGVDTVLRGSTAAARRILTTLRSGEVLGALIDQDIRIEGAVVDFFGRPALTPTGPVALAQRAGAAVVRGATWRLPDGSHRVRFDPPLEIGPGESAVEEHTAAFTLWLEERIREHPDQWVWMHRRWRRGQRRRDRARRKQEAAATQAKPQQ